MPNETKPADLLERYVALWNEPDAEARRQAIRQLWTEDGAHTLLSPPQAIKDAADQLGFRPPPLEMRGHEALEARVTRAYDEFVAPGEFAFRSAQAVRLGDVVTLTWEMVSTGNGDGTASEVAGGGVDILVLDADGRIQADYQIIPG